MDIPFIWLLWAISATGAYPTSPNSEPAWVKDPDGRGTIGILLPCLITLSLCVWTAVHPNINQLPTAGRLFSTKFTWVVLGILSPELVLWVAFQQWLEARRIRMIVMRIRRREEGMRVKEGYWKRLKGMGGAVWVWIKGCCTRRRSKEPEMIDPTEFSMTQAFFVLMGGYAVHPGDFRGLPLTLSPYGFLCLYARGDIREEDLDETIPQDKTKADGIAKFIVCVQAIWFVTQGIARRAQDLPVPLLELHTIIHVFLSLALYICWWSKPSGVEYPVKLNLEQDLAERIYACYNPKWKPKRDRVPREEQGDAGTEISVSVYEDSVVEEDSLDTNKPGSSALSVNSTASSAPSTHSTSASEKRPVSSSSSSHSTHLGKDSIPRAVPNIPKLVKRQNTFFSRLLKTFHLMNRGNDDLYLLIYHPFHNSFRPWFPLSEDEMTATEHRVTALSPFPPHAVFDPAELQRYAGVKIKTDGSPVIMRARMVLTGADSGRVYRGFGVAMIMVAVLSLFYGGTHAIAWNSHFPTYVELMIWRVASITIAALTFAPLLLGYYGLTYVERMNEMKIIKWLSEWEQSGKLSNKEGGRVFSWIDKSLALRIVLLVLFSPLIIVGGIAWMVFMLLFMYMGYILPISLVLCRVFIVVEAFISLRALPKGSFETVEWSNYWPHF